MSVEGIFAQLRKSEQQRIEESKKEDLKGTEKIEEAEETVDESCGATKLEEQCGGSKKQPKKQPYAVKEAEEEETEEQEEVDESEEFEVIRCNECGSVLTDVDEAEDGCPYCGSLDVSEKTVRVVRDGKVVTKNVRTTKRRLTPAQKAALAKARKKAHTASANKARAKSMKVRSNKGL